MQRLRLTTSDDVAIEAELSVPDGARVAVVLAHPHPLYGGSMRDGAPAHLFERLPAEGIAAIRFNFRGVGASSGSHDRGRAERLDLQAAIDAVGDLPVVVCGWSFGADVSLSIVDPRILGWCPIAPPLAVVPVDDMAAAADPRPKHLLVPEHDQYNPPDAARETTRYWTSTTVEVLDGTDHFLGGALSRVATAVTVLTRSLLI